MMAKSTAPLGFALLAGALLLSSFITFEAQAGKRVGVAAAVMPQATSQAPGTRCAR